jgi:ribosomal protein S18 acetylase RimI-like enzyme/ribonuclease HII
VALRRCYLPAALAPSVAQALRDSGRLAEEAGNHLITGRCQEGRVRVHSDGTIEVDELPDALALLTQCIKGVLPRGKSSFLVGADEAGMAGEAASPTAALVLIPPEVRAELIVAGVADSKRVGKDRVHQLAEVVDATAMRTERLQVADPGPGASRASAVASALAQRLVAWHKQGQLPGDVQITIDQTDEKAFAKAMGPLWTELQGCIRFERRADQEHVEVAAASILARASSDGPRQAPTRRAPILGHFRIGPHKASDREQIIDFLHRLVTSYPDIGKWIGKVGDPGAVWTQVEEKKLHLIVARLDDAVAGFCLTKDKDPRNAKISTFYVAPRYRRQRIGHRMLNHELERLARQRTRRVMVTFGHEEFENMERFFRDHGFTVDGISPQRYRDNSYEVIMGKRLRHEPVQAVGFRVFVEHDVFRMQGFDIQSLDEETFLATPRQSLLQGPASVANRLLVHATTSHEPEQQIDHVIDLARKHGATPVLASAYGLPADKPIPKGVEVLDARELETMFYPATIERSQAMDLVIPIKPEYVRQLFPNNGQTMLGIQKVGLGTTNVYYRVARNIRGMRRGDRLFFYESDGRGVFGHARLDRIEVGSPKRLHGLHGSLGAWTAERIAEHTDGKDGAAYRFRQFKELAQPVSHDVLKRICPKFNPQTIYKVDRGVGDAIIQEGTQ